MTIGNVWRLLYGEEVLAGRKVGPAHYRVRCPFHDDHTPSCDVSIDKDAWYCRAGCGGGGMVDLVVRELGVPAARAKAWLRANE